MVFLYALAVALAVWSVGAIQLLPAVRDAGRPLAWFAGALALATAACVVYGAYGLARYGDWLSISTAQALHMLLGEGNPALRRAESAALNRAAFRRSRPVPAEIGCHARRTALPPCQRTHARPPGLAATTKARKTGPWVLCSYRLLLQ